MKSRILTPSTLLLLVHIKAAITGTHGAAIDTFRVFSFMNTEYRLPTAEYRILTNWFVLLGKIGGD